MTGSTRPYTGADIHDPAFNASLEHMDRAAGEMVRMTNDPDIGGATYIHNPGHTGQVMPTNWSGERDSGMPSVGAIGGHENPTTGERWKTTSLTADRSGVHSAAQFDRDTMLSQMVKTALFHGEKGGVGTGTWLEEGKPVAVDVSTIRENKTPEHEEGINQTAVERGEIATFLNNPAKERYTAHGQHFRNVYEDGSPRPAHDPAPRPADYDKWLAKHEANN